MISDVCYSYTDLINSRRNFIRTAREGAAEYDDPEALYFKILFGFSDEYGLLSVPKESSKESENISNLKDQFSNKGADKPKYLDFNNTAYNYLLLNGETQRAQYLQDFVYLLSNISADTPWFFQSIEGVDSALERKLFDSDEVKLTNDKQNITIKCLGDAYDTRIATLLDLYRAACFSYQRKKEIVPRNLRKFNMYILIFGAPIYGYSGRANKRISGYDEKTGEPIYSESFAKIKIPQGIDNAYIPNVKLIEFKNCEFSYSSAKSGYGSMSNEAPFSQQFNIDIYYDDVYEYRYNEFLQTVVTDFLKIDNGSDGIDGDNKASVNMLDKEIGQLSDVTKEQGKHFWTDTNTSNIEVLDNNVIISTNEYNAKQGISRKGGFLTSQFNNISDVVSNLISVPSISFNTENIHDNGKVNTIGKYEYLNRLSNSDGLLGGLVTTTAGAAIGGVTETVKNAYLGNIHGLSLSNVRDYISKGLSGDAMGIVSSATKNKAENSDLTSGSTKLSGYDNTEEKTEKSLKDKKLWDTSKIQKKRSQNIGKSIYNNL